MRSRFPIAVGALLCASGCSLIIKSATFGDGDGGQREDATVDSGVDGGPRDAGTDAGRDAGVDGGCAGFGECVPATTETGLNDCGNEATRTCSDTCEWSPFVSMETAETCDYCDDDPDGFREREAGFASVTRSYELAVDVVTQGTALGTCFGTSCQIDLVDGDGVGGTFLTESVVLGYGGGTVTLDMSATARGSDPGLGWAFVAYADPSPAPLLGSASELGVNRSATGFAVEWSVAGTDTVRIRRLDSSGADPVLVEAATGRQLAGPAGSSAAQMLTVIWEPDDPVTPADETTVTVTHPCLGVPTCDPIGCGGTTGMPCGFTLRAGDRVRYGVVAGSSAASPARFRLYDSTVRLSGLCP